MCLVGAFTIGSYIYVKYNDTKKRLKAKDSLIVARSENPNEPRRRGYHANPLSMPQRSLEDQPRFARRGKFQADGPLNIVHHPFIPPVYNTQNNLDLDTIAMVATKERPTYSPLEWVKSTYRSMAPRVLKTTTITDHKKSKRAY